MPHEKPDPIKLEPGEKLIVVAGNYVQARQWAVLQGIPLSQVVYPAPGMAFRHLRGLPRGTKYLMVGTYFDRDPLDRQEVRAALHFMEATPI